MDSTPTPPYRSRTKSAASGGVAQIEGQAVPHLSLALITSHSSPPNINKNKNNKNKTTTPSPSCKSSDSLLLPLRELLLLSPSPLRKRSSKTRLSERLDMAADDSEPRRRCKSRGAALVCASPRNTSRRSRKDSGLAVQEIAKPRKRRSNKEKEKLFTSLPPSSPGLPLPMPILDDGDDECGRRSLDRIGQLMSDLLMWRDVARSTLWFGLGSLFFLSSCFSKDINFSIFRAISQLGLLFLGASFLSNSISQRNHNEKKRDFTLKEDDILRLAKLILPPVNFAISKTRSLFSGEPSMTLKVVPFFLLGAEYGHLITLWRLSMLAFFTSFTIPRLYSCYLSQMNRKVECLKWWVLEAWGGCTHKKIVAPLAATAFWNLSSVKTRIFTAFISLVILRYCRQHMVHPVENEEGNLPEQEKQQALVVEEPEAVAEEKQEQQHALVVAKVPSDQ